MTDIVDTILPMITPTLIVTLAIIYVGYRLLLALIDAGVQVSKNKGNGNGNGESIFKRLGRWL